MEVDEGTGKGLRCLVRGRVCGRFEENDPDIEATGNVQIELMLSRNDADESVDFADKGLKVWICLSPACRICGCVWLQENKSNVESVDFSACDLLA